MYTVESATRPRANQSDYSGLHGADAYALIGPGAPPLVHYSAVPVSNEQFSPVTPVYTEPHSTYPFDSHIARESQNPSAYSSAPVIPSLPRRRDSHPLGISVPPSMSNPSTYTPSTASPSDSWPPTMKEDQSGDPPKKKSRREKPKIALAPDQPPTTQGKPRARVYVACLQCRNRKIRCDGAKPICHNCGRRSGGGDCNYDAVPRRRGPDKTPGARQRMARELRQEMESDATTRRRRRRRDPEAPRHIAPTGQYGHISRSSNEDALSTLPLNGSLSPTSSSDYSISPSYLAPLSSLTSPLEGARLYGGCSCHGLVQCPSSQPYVSSRTQPLPFVEPTSNFVELEHRLLDNVSPLVSRGHITAVDENGEESDVVSDISSEPSIRFSRKIWFESFMHLRFLFRSSNYCFFGTFFDPVKREQMQPSLILAALALAIFWQSSEIGQGSVGRTRALRLREEAQSALEASFNAGSIDETLAQAAWLLALFEVCAHPEHSTARSVSAIVMLDSIIRCLALTVVDADDPNTSVFGSGQVPRIGEPPSSGWTATNGHHAYFSDVEHVYHTPVSSTTDTGSSRCSCASLTLGEHWPTSLDHTPLWATTPRWDPTWSPGDIRKESSRRLCWSAISLAAGHLSYAAASQSHMPELFISDPGNYALLFSGESICRSPSLSPSAAKDTVWALYDRSFLLWHICARVRTDTSMSDVEKGQFAVKAWLETDAIEKALNKHTCGIEKAYIFQGREYLFNTRMYISFEFQRYIPLVNSDVNGFFHRKKAEEWLTHQAAVAERYMQGLHTITGNSNNSLARRPFFVFWFMSQVLRALRLWHCDNSLTIALDVCKAFLPAIDYLNALWPCEEQRQRYMHLRERLDSAFYTAGIPQPPPPNFSLPDSSSSVL
ncbi:hypothetical protein BT96DRAFT_915878 [Gymnopus androsaceus JB14]|uniref:Zn(2)-C6 fungal-type domain-containing protein n=1 Tax=Gymnopus androsaceus JB14 TaxID=1447944 RepID=A0A6A4IAC3_9AGAR|nr:hypothetical protein BT96DRAFT_915878 [Gymnopus androsaceus JB14]